MKKLQYIIYQVIRWFVKLFYPKMQVTGLENLPPEPCIIVSNHAQMNGPIAGELYFPGRRYIWCAGEMMELKAVPAYAYQDFWSQKPKAVRWFYKLLSYLIAPVSVCVFNSAHTIEVCRGSRILQTFRETTEKLQEGANVIIFPEHGQPHNTILCQFQDGFVSVARDYYRQTGERLAFVPMYLAPSLKKMVLGEPVVFDPESPIKEERRRISALLTDRITELALALPRHKVVPYHNIPRKKYGYNLPEEAPHEKACD